MILKGRILQTKALLNNWFSAVFRAEYAAAYATALQRESGSAILTSLQIALDFCLDCFPAKLPYQPVRVHTTVELWLFQGHSKLVADILTLSAGASLL